MAANVLQFPLRPANDNPDDIPPFDPSNPAHARAWRTMFLLGREELKRRIEGTL